MEAPIRGPRAPLLNMRFRVEIEGLPESGVVEVVFPEARLVRGRNGGSVRYGTLILRRGIARSSDWYDWWNEARRARKAPSRSIAVTLLDETGASAQQWVFSKATPLAYALSNLNALGQEALIETLELTVGGFEAATDSAPSPRRKRGVR